MMTAPRTRASKVLSKNEFDLLRAHIHRISGIVLDDSKVSLMENRLWPLLERYECGSYTDLYTKSRTNTAIDDDICAAISTGETSFFRDSTIFDLIGSELVPHFLNKSTNLRIWSAASSNGQEAYSLAMLLSEIIPNIEKYDIRIDGTDISNDAIAHASYGAYSSLEVNRGLSPTRISRHFEPHERGYRVRDELRYMAHFRKINLLEDFSALQAYDLILCRNVAIYFDKESKKSMFERMLACLRPRGRLVIGSTETLWQVTDMYERCETNGTVYYKRRGDE